MVSESTNEMEEKSKDVDRWPKWQTTLQRQDEEKRRRKRKDLSMTAAIWRIETKLFIYTRMHIAYVLEHASKKYTVFT